MEKVGKVKKNLNVVITGAARGIGRETVRAFNRVGALVIALDKNENGLRILSNETGCLTQVCDVTDILSVEAAFKMIMEKGISIDLLVSNALIPSVTINPMAKTISGIKNGISGTWQN